MSGLVFDHLHLSVSDRRLIAAACQGGSIVYLAPLDKGLSGSSVWQAKWRLINGGESKLHVFKIGIKSKLIQEETAIRQIASVIEHRFPQVNLYKDPDSDWALLRQEFVGVLGSETKSLRQHIEKCSEPTEARKVIRKLYLTRMKSWHPPPPTSLQSKNNTFREALDWWVKRTDLPRAAENIGTSGLENSLQDFFELSIEQIIERTNEILDRQSLLTIGPVHGDLHGQNVLIDEHGHMELIDYGWTNQEKWKAIDFLMMECSLKFLATPPHARLADLLLMEQVIDLKGLKTNSTIYQSLKTAIHGHSLDVIVHAIREIRACAQSLGVIQNFDQYRCGLIALTAGLASMPTLINRVFLFHSLAYQLTEQFRKTNG